MRLASKYQLIKFLETIPKAQGKVLEVGPLHTQSSAYNYFKKFGWEYDCLLLKPSPGLPNQIVGDVSNLGGVIPDCTYDAVFCSDVFEHVQKPWLAAEEIQRIIKPGGYALVFTLFSWRYHPCPDDYFRFSTSAMCSLFNDMKKIACDYDLTDRRQDLRGFSKSKKDAPPIDHMGGFRENWAVYFIGEKL